MMQFFRKHTRPIMLVIVVIFIISCFTVYGVNRGADDAGTGQRDYAVAKVNGENVMRSRLDTEMVQFIRNIDPQGQNISSADYPLVRNELINQIAIVSELDKEVKARKLTVSKEEIDEAIRNIEASFPTREIYLEQLQQAGLDDAKLRQNLQEQMVRQKVFEEVTAAASTDQQEMQSFYETMKTYAFQKPEGFKMNLAHFKIEESAEQARKDIESGKNWDDVMTAASEDVLAHFPYAEPMLIPANDLVGDVEFLKDLPMNKVSKVVKLADTDYMLALKRTREQAGTATYNEVSADIEQMIVGQKRQGLQSQFLQDLRSRASVELLDNELFTVPNAASEDLPGAPVEEDDENAAVVEPSASDDTVEVVVEDASGDVVEDVVIETQDDVQEKSGDER